MRSLLAVVAALVAAATVVVAIPHVVTEFTIPIPHMAATPGADSLSGDVFALLTDSGITAVNLSTKAVLWNYASESATDFYVTGSSVLVVGSNFFEGLALSTGTSTWKNTSMSTFSSAEDIKFSLVGSNVIVTTESQLVSVNPSTGAVAYQMQLNTPPMTAGNYLYFTNSDFALVALDLQTGVVAWTKLPKNNNNFNAVLYADSNYVVTSYDTLSGDTVLYVAHASNGEKKLKLEGMSGMNEDDGPISISGTNLTIVAGDNPTTYTIDLDTGFIIAQAPFNGGGGGGGGGGSQGTYSLTLANGDVLKIHSTSDHTTPALYGEGFSIQKSTAGGDFTTVCPNTPSFKHFNMAYLGDGLLKVGNLQGWVLFYIQGTTCTMLEANEMAPGYTTKKGGVVYKYNNDFIEVEGKSIIGYKIVQ